jgi:hypothetical protein
MNMAVIKFPCTTCQQPMAVGPELAGSQVRCPHCLQVLVAPSVAAEPVEIGPDNPFQFSGASQDSESPDGAPEPTPFQYAPPAVESESLAPASNLPGGDFSSPGESSSPTLQSGRGPTPAEGGRSNLVLAILAPYALFMTVMAIYYYNKFSETANRTPLDQIPDLLGEYQQKQTKGSPQSRTVPLPPPDQNLPARLVTTLGQPLQIGAIEVTPLSVEYRAWSGLTKVKNRAEPRKTPIKPTLVMHVRLKNVSPDLTFYPTDPYFDRNPKQANDRPYTLVDVGGHKYFGGLIEYITEPGGTERTWLAGQENDDKPLAHGELRETVLVARPGDGLFDAVQKAKDPAVWRMHVRRGLMPYHGTEVPVSAVIGVSFTAADIRKAG